MKTMIGQSIDRVDGRAKLTGTSRYTAEITLANLTYAFIVGAHVSSGRISSLNTHEAEQAEGILAVLTRHNLGRIAAPPSLFIPLFGRASPGMSFFPMQDDTVHYAGQPVAIVIAETLEHAQYAASLIHIHYEEKLSLTTIDQGRDQSYEPKRVFGGLVPGHQERGDVEAGLAKAVVRIDETYKFAANHHNPIEPPVTTAVWDGDQLTLYDSTQGIVASQLTVAALLGISPSKIRVISQFVGGSFGSKSFTWPHVTLAALAARHIGRPVRLILSREQMFYSCGHREEQQQRIVLGADQEGHLTALRHHKLSLTSPFDDWAEFSLGMSAKVYTCPNYENTYRLIHGNTITPTIMRAPGESTGMFALECTMDELAYKLGLDPLELRLRNYANVDPTSGYPWSSKGLRNCYLRGADLFGWHGRNPAPRSQRDGNWLIGSGMATAAYPVSLRMPTQRARARLYADGNAVIQIATQEFGTGIATAMTQVAADGLGIPLDDIRFEYGNTNLPNSTASVGSAGAGMVSAAVHNAVTTLRDQIIAQAIADDRSPLHGADPHTVVVGDGRMMLRDQSEIGETYSELFQRHFQQETEALGSWTPPSIASHYGLATFGVQFAEVAIDVDLGITHVRRMVGAFAPGRILNHKTARSQLMGGMLWGLGQALLEATYMDSHLGRWTNANLSDYLVAVNADTPDVTVDIVEVHDEVVNPLGVKGCGEIGQVGAAAAIANAVFHATGRRIHQLPIRIEHLL